MHDDDQPPDASADPDTLAGIDYRGSRRLTGGEEWFWYLFAAVTYIVAGIWHKWILNWLIGPIWLVVIIVAGPWLFDTVRATLAGRGGR